MEYIDGLPLNGRNHRNALPPAFFDALQGILDGMAGRDVYHLDLRSPSNVLATPSRAPAIVDLASAVTLRMPRALMRVIQRRALRKLRERFEGDRELTDEGSQPWERGNLELGDTRVFYRDQGSADDPVPALFLHDVGLTSLLFEEVIARAEEFGRRGIAIDLPGFGASRRRVWSLDPTYLAGQIERLLDVLRLDRVDVVGFGWGGRLGRELWVRCPARVRKLRTAATGFRKYWAEGDKDPERLRRRIATSLPSGLREDRRRELEYFLALVPARNLVRVYESIEGEAPADDFWPIPPGDPDQIWRELADHPHSEVE